jgi:DNA polymerase-1
MKLIIDGNYIAYRVFHKSPPLTNSRGEPTAVIHGFLQYLLSVIDKLKPEEIYVVFDAPGKNHRHDMLEAYKETREAMPEDLRPQIAALKEIVPLMGLPMLCVSGYEADDVIYTLSQTGGDVLIASKDKDLHQLVDERVKMLDPSSSTPVDREGVIEKFGLPPEKILDMLALSGDTADNIPGVAGVGPKTAQKLLDDYGTLEGVYENIDSIKGKLKEKLEADREKAFLSRELARLIYITDMITPNTEKDDTALSAKLSELELNTIHKRIFSSSAKQTSKIEIKDIAITACIEGSIWVAENGKAEEKTPASIKSGALLYDLKHIYKATGIKPEKPLDIMLISWMNEPDIGGIKPIKEETPEAFLARLGESAQAEINKLEENGLTSLYESMEIDFTYILAEMERKGVKLDPERINIVEARLEDELSIIQAKLVQAVGRDINLNSPKQLSSFLYEELGIKPFKKTKTGFSTSEEALRELLVFNPAFEEIINNILRHRELSKLLSTYTHTLVDFINPETKRIHTEFRQTGTATGRLSSTAPNMQNIPQKGDFAGEIRSAFIAEDGYSFVSFDYSQIELRILAHLTQDKALVEAYKNGLDIHTQTAAKVFDVPENKVDSKMRRMAKAVNFGIIYGLSAFGLSRDTGVSPKEAQIFIDKYFSTYSGVKAFIAKTVEEAKKNGFAKTILGRKRFISDINSRNRNIAMKGERVAVNTQMQGSAADIIKLAMLECDRWIRKSGLDAHLILQLHDELVFEVKEEQAEELARAVRKIMENAVPLSVPLSVNGSVGKNLGELK